MSETPKPIPPSDFSSRVRLSSIAQPPSTRVSPCSVSMAYTLTARRPSIGSGSGIRWIPSATGQAPGSVQCRPESGETAWAVLVEGLTPRP